MAHDDRGDRPLRSKLFSDSDQPTRAEAKVGLAIAVVLLALYSLWVWAPWESSDGNGYNGTGRGDQSCVSTPIDRGDGRISISCP